MNKPLNVRRCHCCGEFLESYEDIKQCGACSRHLLPFYYFDVKEQDYSDDQEDAEDKALREALRGYGPIRGLTAYW